MSVRSDLIIPVFFRGFIFFIYLASYGHFTPGQNLNCKIQFDNVPLFVYHRERKQDYNYLTPRITGNISGGKRGF